MIPSLTSTSSQKNNLVEVMLLLHEKKPDLEVTEQTQNGKEHPDNEQNLLCAMCNAIITNKAYSIKIDDHHEHTMANPHGIVYHIGCFQSASGCIPYGEPSDLFPWFIGYLWCIALCGNCHEHLGWYFINDQHLFIGLITDRLYQEGT